MDISISLALLTVYGAGIYAIFARTGEIYFDSITMFLFFITLTRYLETRARYRSSHLIKRLNQQQPSWVTRLVDDKNDVIPINQLAVHDLILVKPGAVIPVDGIIKKGESSISESLLTGEMTPKFKQPHDHVVAGSLNVDHPLHVQVTKVGDETTLATILKLFERAQLDRPRIMTLTQRFSHYFILAQLAIACLAFLYWLPFSVQHGFWIAISILVVTCPCALAIATPIALTASMNALSNIGFLCTRGHVLESLADPTDIVFDKTGTLTDGAFTIHKIELLSDVSKETVLQIAAALESQSEHPIAMAFRSISITTPPESVRIHPNQGVEGTISGMQYYIGTVSYIQKNVPTDSVILPTDIISTSIILADQNKWLAVFYLEDKLRAHTTHTLSYLTKRGFRIHLLSGDNLPIVKKYADMLNIQSYQANYSPQDKLYYVKDLQASGKRVVMIGDGINDAPVLMQAHVSIAMANAADITRINADAVLMKPDLSVLIDTFSHAKRTHAIIRQCLWWAIFYNIISLPLAIAGIIAPYIAAILMSASSIFVVGNALRLIYIKQRYHPDTPVQLTLVSAH